MADIYHASPPPLRVDPGFSPKQWAIQTDTSGMVIGIVVAPELETMARELFLAEPPLVDYREMLVKFIRLARENDYFVPERRIREQCPGTVGSETYASLIAAEDAFTDTEWAELQRLAGEAPR